MIGAHAAAGRAEHRVGRHMDFDAQVLEGWERRDAMPDALGPDTQGFGAAVADLRGSGRPDLVLFWVQQLGAGNFGCYRIGWALDAAGRPTGGWSPSSGCPCPCRR